MKKSDVFQNVSTQVHELLKQFATIEQCGSILYIIDQETYAQIKELEKELLPLQTETRRGQAYQMDKIVNILNPEGVAFKYHVGIAKRSKLITDKNKIIKQLPAEYEINKNKVLLAAEKTIKESNLTGDNLADFRNTINKTLQDEKTKLENVLKNPEHYKIIISGFNIKKEWGHITYHYKELSGENKSVHQKHLKTTYPNVLVYEDISANDQYRIDMEVAKFIENSENIFGNVFIQKEDNE